MATQCGQSLLCQYVLPCSTLIWESGGGETARTSCSEDMIVSRRAIQANLASLGDEVWITTPRTGRPRR